MRKRVCSSQEMDTPRNRETNVSHAPDLDEKKPNQVLPCLDTLEMSSQLVALNVGGTRFVTRWKTLTAEKTYFSNLLGDEGILIRDSEGPIFIDRNPDLFREILFFLRTGKVDLNNLTMDVSQLYDEAKFYQIQSLVAKLSQHIVVHDDYNEHHSLQVYHCIHNTCSKWKTVHPFQERGPIVSIQTDGLWLIIVYSHSFDLYHTLHDMRWSSPEVDEGIVYMVTQLTTEKQRVPKRIAAASYEKTYRWEFPDDWFDIEPAANKEWPQTVNSAHNYIITLHFIGGYLALVEEGPHPPNRTLRFNLHHEILDWNEDLDERGITANIPMHEHGAMLVAEETTINEKSIISEITPHTNKTIFENLLGHTVRSLAYLKKDSKTFEIACGTFEGVVHIISNEHRRGSQYILRKSTQVHSPRISRVSFSMGYLMTLCMSQIRSWSHYRVFHVTSQKIKRKDGISGKITEVGAPRPFYIYMN